MRRCYIGESDLNLYELGREHLEDAHKHKEGSHIFKYMATQDPNLLTQPTFAFKS